MFDIYRAAKRLDIITPDWFTRVDLETLDMRRASTCVLGQVYGNYYDAPRYVRGILRPLTFQLSPFCTSRWVKQILKRRENEPLYVPVEMEEECRSRT